ncbi:hypothetical protein ACOTC5_32255 [Achromobacter xylosoxidans]
MREWALLPWRAFVTMCRSDTRYPVIMKPALAAIALAGSITEWNQGRPLPLVGLAILLVLLIDYLFTLRDVARQPPPRQ